MDINETTAKRVIKRQYNIIVDEEFKLKKTLSMETDNSMPEYSFSGLYTRVEYVEKDNWRLAKEVDRLNDYVQILEMEKKK